MSHSDRLTSCDSHLKCLTCLIIFIVGFPLSAFRFNNVPNVPFFIVLNENVFGIRQMSPMSHSWRLGNQ